MSHDRSRLWWLSRTTAHGRLGADVWAPALIDLLQQAARGMYALMHARLQSEPREAYRFEIAAPDREVLLVTFLAELLYFTQRDEVGFDQFDLAWEGAAADRRRWKARRSSRSPKRSKR